MNSVMSLLIAYVYYVFLNLNEGNLFPARACVCMCVSVTFCMYLCGFYVDMCLGYIDCK